MKRLVAVALLVGLAGAGLGAYAYVRRHAVPVIVPTAGPPRAAAAPALAPTDWPWWRGPMRSSVSATGRPPVTWSESDAVRWKVAVPGRGHASPVVCGDRVILATADESEQVLSLLCYRRRDGALLWSVPVQRGGFMAKHPKNSHASPTPACDGSAVYLPYAAEDSLFVTAVDLTGQVRWRTRVGPYVAQWGYGSSPVCWNGLVIVAGESKGPRLADLAATTSYLAALDAATGEPVWRARRPREYSYGTPVVGDVAGRPQLLLAGPEAVRSYDPATGQELWHCDWPIGRTAGTVAFDDRRVYASGTIPGPEMLGVRADGTGDVTASHVEWRVKRGAADVPSPLRYGPFLFVVTDLGVLAAHDPDTGKAVWQQRLPGAVSASPMGAAGRVYVAGEDGRTAVFRAEPPFERLAENRLDGPIYATPSPAGDELFVRTEQSLYCLTAPAVPPPAVSAARR
jgi:outer membrane protein assembly factor BamB